MKRNDIQRPHRRLHKLAAASLAILFVSVSTAGAQDIGNPTVSPYLNLINRGQRNPAINYFNQVRAPQDIRAATVNLNQQFQSVENQINEISESGQQRLTTTGHQVTFMNYSSYYPMAMSIRGRGGIGGAASRGIGGSAGAFGRANTGMGGVGMGAGGMGMGGMGMSGMGMGGMGMGGMGMGGMGMGGMGMGGGMGMN